MNKVWILNSIVHWIFSWDLRIQNNANIATFWFNLLLLKFSLSLLKLKSLEFIVNWISSEFIQLVDITLSVSINLTQLFLVLIQFYNLIYWLFFPFFNRRAFWALLFFLMLNQLCLSTDFSSLSLIVVLAWEFLWGFYLSRFFIIYFYYLNIFGWNFSSILIFFT